MLVFKLLPFILLFKVILCSDLKVFTNMYNLLGKGGGKLLRLSKVKQ